MYLCSNMALPHPNGEGYCKYLLDLKLDSVELTTKKILTLFHRDVTKGAQTGSIGPGLFAVCKALRNLVIPTVEELESFHSVFKGGLHFARNMKKNHSRAPERATKSLSALAPEFRVA